MALTLGPSGYELNLGQPVDPAFLQVGSFPGPERYKSEGLSHCLWAFDRLGRHNSTVEDAEIGAGPSLASESMAPDLLSASPSPMRSFQTSLPGNRKSFSSLRRLSGRRQPPPGTRGPSPSVQRGPRVLFCLGRQRSQHSGIGRGGVNSESVFACAMWAYFAIVLAASVPNATVLWSLRMRGPIGAICCVRGPKYDRCEIRGYR